MLRLKSVGFKFEVIWVSRRILI